MTHIRFHEAANILKPVPSLLLLFLGLMFSPVIASAQIALAVQYGRITAANAHPSAGASQSFHGLRWGNLVEDNFEIGILHSSSGWFFDMEYSLREHFAVGSGSIDGLLVVELRGETLTNFLSGIVGLAGGVTETNYRSGDTQAVSGRPCMLLLRLGGGVSFPLGTSTELSLGVSHLDFRYWRMTSGVLTLTF